MAEQNTLSAALEYLGRGWSPIALCPPDHVGVSKVHQSMCGSPGKAPQVGWKEFQTRLPTADEIQAMWTQFPAANVGVCMGPVSGIIGLDIDGEEGERLLNEACGEELPDTCEFTTPGGGRRLLFQTPPGVQMPGPTHRFGGAKHSGMSFLSHGSQTVMPPSRHANGGVLCGKEQRKSGRSAAAGGTAMADRLGKEAKSTSQNGSPHLQLPAKSFRKAGETKL